MLLHPEQYQSHAENRADELRSEAAARVATSNARRTRSAQRRARRLDRFALLMAAFSAWSGRRAHNLHTRARLHRAGAH